MIVFFCFLHPQVISVTERQISAHITPDKSMEYTEEVKVRDGSGVTATRERASRPASFLTSLITKRRNSSLCYICFFE